MVTVFIHFSPFNVVLETMTLQQDFLIIQLELYSRCNYALCISYLGDQSPLNLPTDAAAGSTGAGVTVAVIVCLILCVAGWVGYAYFFPHTTSGQLLIRVNSDGYHI